MTDPDHLDSLRTGMRAVVRHRIAHGSQPDPRPGSGQGLTDALGVVVAMDERSITVQTRRGTVQIDRSAVVAAKEVPPPPSRRGHPHLAVSMDDLELIMVGGWEPLETEHLGDWLLRAGGGFTGRANSVLPLGSPDIPLSSAVDHCERWYDERGLRRLFVLFGPEGFAVQDDPLGQELIGRGYVPFSHTVILTASTAALPTQTPDSSGATVRLQPTLSPQWWEACAERSRAESTGVTPELAKAVLAGSPDLLFASLELDGAVVGVARIAFARAWAGVSGVNVVPGHRRTGIATQLMSAAADAARARGIRSIYLQVTEDNAAARQLYGRLRFVTHHEYVYLGA